VTLRCNGSVVYQPEVRSWYLKEDASQNGRSIPEASGTDHRRRHTQGVIERPAVGPDTRNQTTPIAASKLPASGGHPEATKDPVYPTSVKSTEVTPPECVMTNRPGSEVSGITICPGPIDRRQMKPKTSSARPSV
jgi:hypothetical protein